MKCERCGRNEEPTEEMVEAGMAAAKAERWILTRDYAFRVVIRKILQAALAAAQPNTQQKEG